MARIDQYIHASRRQSTNTEQQAMAEQANAEVDAWLSKLEAALKSGKLDEALDLFVADDDDDDGGCLWRDFLSFTWNIITMEGRSQVREMLQACLKQANPSNWKRQGNATPEDPTGIGRGPTAWLRFETSVGDCSGHVRLQSGGGGRCTTLLTTMAGLKAHPEATGKNRVKGVEHGAFKQQRKTWSEKRSEEESKLGYEEQPYVVIVGGGQAGIVLAARLRQLGVSAIIVEKNARPGDSWRNRYKSLCLHDPVWYDHLPYLSFPSNWPVFAPKDKMGDWLESYTKLMELVYWSSSEVVRAKFDENDHVWEVHVRRHQPEAKDVVLRPKQLVLATGMSGFPNVPKLKGAERFKGEIHHSSAHGDSAAYAGRLAVILGSNNSAHDIAAALWENGAAEVTMIQRSSTHIVRSEMVLKYQTGPLYSEEAVAKGITTDIADMMFATVPMRLVPRFFKPVAESVKKDDADFYSALKASGFMLDFGADETGLFAKYLRRGSGYYIDVGASQLVIDNQIKLRSGVTIAEVKEKSVVLTDGSEVAADLIVLATGYTSMNSWAAKLISQEVADKVGKCWGYGSDTPKDPGPWVGELRNMWKPTKQEALWFHGGNLHQVRHYSLYLALQLKARMEGIPTAVYGIPEVHHLA